MDHPSIYDFKIKALNADHLIDLSEGKGKKMLLVNVASKCGFTGQYKSLQKLQEEHGPQLLIIGFPCNQFFFQESGTEEEIQSFCEKNYGVTFPITTKIKVKGKHQHPIYRWLTKKKYNGVDDFKVSWNFNKFLIDEDGTLLGHFSAKVRPYDDSILQLIRG